MKITSIKTDNIHEISNVNFFLYYIGPGTNSISGTDDDDLNDSDLDDDDDDEEVDVDGLDDQDAEGVENAIIDIREPLINLKKKLEAKLEIDLTHYDFYLQGTYRSFYQVAQLNLFFDLFNCSNSIIIPHQI